jgi:hypothetical protein
VNRLAWAAFAVLAATSPGAAQDGEPNAIAENFYRVYSTFHPSDGIPDVKGRAKYAVVLSDDLNTLLAQAGAAEDKFGAAHKDSPPLVEGDLFTSNFEGATSYTVSPCVVSDGKARCKVALIYQSAGDKPVGWTDTLMLVEASKGWAIDDIGYGASWAFGNKGTLKQTLKRVIDDAGS